MPARAEQLGVDHSQPDGPFRAAAKRASCERDTAWVSPISACVLALLRVLKVRRVGNSNVVSIPRELEARGYAPGTSVLLEELESDELRIMPTDHVHDRIRGIGRRAVEEYPEALRILAGHDPDSGPPKP